MIRLLSLFSLSNPRYFSSQCLRCSGYCQPCYPLLDCIPVSEDVSSRDYALSFTLYTSLRSSYVQEKIIMGLDCYKCGLVVHCETKTQDVVSYATVEW